MIRLAFMTDEARVIGASTAAGNEARFAALPEALHGVMKTLYAADHVVVGAGSLGPWRQAEGVTVYVLTRDASFDPGASHIQVVTDVAPLVERFAESEEELLVAGGATVFGLFLDHAAQLDVALADELVAGDVLFTDWDGRFRLVAEERWEGGRTRRYVPRGKKAQHGVRLYMEGIRDGHAREAIARYTGDRYTQHSTGVADGREGFIAFFEEFLARTPERDIRVLRAIEDGRFVFVHVVQELNGGEARWITADLFDTDADERIIEHWDVIAALEDARQIDGTRDAVDDGQTEANKALVRRFLVDVFQNADLSRFDEVVAGDLVQHELGIEDGRAAYRAAVQAQLEAGWRYDFVFKVLGEGPLVVSYAKVDGPEDSRAQFEIWRVAEGKIAERWVNAEPIGPREDWANGGKF